jgi:hypothetical protein
MDVEEFYAEDARRQTSDEVDYGRAWREGDMQYEVAWVADTGELYAMAEPVSRKAITSSQVTVEVLAVIADRSAVDAALDGWREAMAQPDSLAWVRARVS